MKTSERFATLCLVVVLLALLYPFYQSQTRRMQRTERALPSSVPFTPANNQPVIKRLRGKNSRMSTITLTSSPTSFSVTNGSSVSVTFAIPAGFVASSGQWSVAMTNSGGGSPNSIISLPSHSSSPGPAQPGAYNSTPHTETTNLTTSQISDVNAAAGGNLTANFAYGAPASSTTVTSWTLTLTGTLPCSYSLFPTGATFDATGHSDTVSVTTQGGCAWTATSGASWVTVTSGGGTGSGTVSYTVAPNTSGSPRTTTLTIAGVTFTISQGAAGPAAGCAPSNPNPAGSGIQVSPYFPPGYFADGYFPAGSDSSPFFPQQSAAIIAAPGQYAREVDIRLYNPDGTRKRMPQQWISELSFEIVEQGGYATGNIQVEVEWENLQLTGLEYLDVWLWGQRVYRGFLKQPQNEIGIPERATPTLYGLMEVLNGYQVRRCLCYADYVDISQVFLDLANEYVKKAGRLPGLLLDCTGVTALNIPINNFCAKGKSFSQAMNALCDTAPGTFIWGCDVDAEGNNRLYFRPRATSVQYKVSVGKDVTAFVYPRDTTAIVNRLFVTGGKADPPNLCLNASFEECAVAGELTSNLLQNNSFEVHEPLKGSSEFAQYWPREFRASRKVYPDTSPTNLARTGSCWMELDNFDDGGPEGIIQSVAIGYPQPIHASVWSRQKMVGHNDTFRIQMYLLPAAVPFDHDADIASYALASFESPDIRPADIYTEYKAFWTPPYISNGAYVCLRFQLTSAGGENKGVLLDDASLWLGSVLAQSWEVGKSVTAGFTVLDWQNRDIAAYDGEVTVKAQANIFSTGGYAELTTTPADRLDAKPGRLYYLIARFIAAAGQTAQVQIGIREYNSDGTIRTTTVSGTATITDATWQVVSIPVTTNANTTAFEPLLRFFDTGTVYVDALGMYEGSIPNLYYPGDTLTAMRDVTSYPGQFDSDVADSLTIWGDREAEVSNDSIVDQTTLDAYCIGALRAQAVPKVEARLTIEQANAPIGLDGQVQILNLPQAPPAMPPAKVKYSVGQSIRLDLDLNNERDDIALLLRAVAGENS